MPAAQICCDRRAPLARIARPSLAWKGSKEFERRSLPGVVKLRKANGGKKESSEMSSEIRNHLGP